VRFFSTIGAVAFMLTTSTILSLPVTAATPVPIASPTVSAKVAASAREWFHRFQSGTIDRSQLDSTVNLELTEDVFLQERERLSSFGDPHSFTFMRSYPVGNAIGYDFLLKFSAGRIVESIAFDGDGKIAGIDFRLFVQSNRSMKPRGTRRLSRRKAIDARSVVFSAGSG
jgi:hypothetical protein